MGNTPGARRLDTVEKLTRKQARVATAITLGYQVATRDLRGFPKVPGLRVSHW
ncbi:MAG TPA: hypothetical protein VM686_10370 [Polyangiaceae bacterium]|nr:hypothetical protein [Polyangiaceae bacterium]